MQAFVRTLALSNKDTLQDVTGCCAKLLSWLTPTEFVKLQYEDVETLLKAAVYVEECVVMFGGTQLLQALIELEPALEKYYRTQADLLLEKAYMTHTLALILQTPAGVQHLPAIEEILRTIYDKLQIEALLKNALEKSKRVEVKSRARLHYAIQQLFQLPKQQIAGAITRLLEQLHFHVLGHVLLEPATSTYYARCCIVAQQMCQQLSAGSAPAHLLDSMQQLAAFSERGRQFYWQCLDNKLFARQLSDFFVQYLQSFTAPEQQPDKWQQYNVDSIIYLVYCALSTESPCRTSLYRAIHKAAILPYYRELIERCTFVYG